MNTTLIYIPKDKDNKHQKASGALKSHTKYPVLTHLITEKGPYLQPLLAQGPNEGHTSILLLITSIVPTV